MTLEPRVGWLLSYSYLWADDHRPGAEEGVKNRPCALVAATRRDGDRIVAIVVPVTHNPPADPQTAIEIPAVTKARLGLDAQRSWIICNEANVFAWPGPDLRAAAGHKPPTIWYGPLPPKLLSAAAREKAAWICSGWASARSACTADRMSGAPLPAMSRPTPHGVSSRDKAQSLPTNQHRLGRAGRFQTRLRTVSRPPTSKAARRRATSSGSTPNSPPAQTK